MKPRIKTFDMELKRTIPASPKEAFDGWLDPECPGTPWNLASKLILDPKFDSLYYWLYINEAGEHKPHYGRFTIFDRPSTVQYTWMSLHTCGLESVVTVTFEPSGDYTLLTLRHENLPDDPSGRGHETGWDFHITRLIDHFASQAGNSRPA